MLTYTSEDMITKFTAALLSNSNVDVSNYVAVVEDAWMIANLVDEKMKDSEAFTKKYFEVEDGTDGAILSQV
jgi:hypothetical protein